MDEEGQPGPANRWFIYGLIGFLGILSFLVFEPFASYTIMGLFLAYASWPIFTRVESALGGRTRTAAAAVVLLVLAVIVLPLVWVTVALIQDLTAIVRTLSPDDVRRFVELLLSQAYTFAGRPPPETGFATEVLSRVVPTIQSYLARQVSNIFGLLSQLMFGLFLMAFVLYYALVDGERLYDFTVSVMPLTDDQSKHLIKRVEATVDAAFLGQIVVAIAQGAVGAVGFVIFGVPNPIFWGVVMMILSILPLIGAFFVWAPAAVILLAQQNTFGGVGLLLWGFLVISSVDNFLRAYFIGARAHIHPVLVLLGVLGGILAFGFIGFVIGPLILAMFIAVLDFWREDYLPMYMGGQVEEAFEVASREEGGPPEE